MIIPNIKWFEWQAKQGQPQSYWWNKIFESEAYWEKSQVDIGKYASQITYVAGELEGLLENQQLIQEISINARLGFLAGMFERASNTTGQKDCHPLIWNAMIFFNLEISEIEGRVKMPDASPLLRECTTWAGYALGKIPGITVREVFANWR
jgi:hypothetical protein